MVPPGNTVSSEPQDVGAGGVAEDATDGRNGR
jgi:hypothetical protein